MAMATMKLPQQLFKHKLLSRGETGWVNQIDKDIVLKYARDERKATCEHDNGIYDTLEKHEPSPYIVRSLLRLPGLSVLAFMTDGSLEKKRIKDNQLRDDAGHFVKLLTKELRLKIEL
jgi:hypothetical protein